MSDDQDKSTDTTPTDNERSETLFKRLLKYLCHADHCKARSVIGVVMGHACSCGLAEAIADCESLAEPK